MLQRHDSVRELNANASCKFVSTGTTNKEPALWRQLGGGVTSEKASADSKAAALLIQK